jgi:hypothetical protein
MGEPGKAIRMAKQSIDPDWGLRLTSSKDITIADANINF